MSNKVRGLWVVAGLAAGGLVAGSAWAESPLKVPAGVVAPPLSVTKAKYFESHPAAWSEFVAQLPRQGTQSGAAPKGKAAGGAWQAVTAAPAAGLCNPLLLTDGTVMFHRCSTPKWYKLTPDSAGNYAGGTWTQLASLPVIGGVQYAPQYHASAVLPDGRVIIEGGEYNGGSAVWTNLGAIYDPVANAWTPVAAPSGSGWSQIGDAQSVVLTNGSFMLGSCCANPDLDAILNPSTLTWTSTGAPNAGDNYQDEQGYSLLPNGNVLTVDVWTNYPTQGNATNAEQYSPLTGVWTAAGNTPVSLPDPYACGTFEMGPVALRGDGTAVAFGANTGCVQGATTDPTAVYDSATGAWIAGPDVPSTCGSGSTTQCDLADAPAALEPDGQVLFAASSGYGNTPTHFFEFSPTNTIAQVADPVANSATSGAYYYNFLVLPNGQILSTDFSNTAEVYTPLGPPVAKWAPVIKNVPTTLVRGTTYTVRGKRLNGVSQGAYYGDDAQDATNYPIVKVVNTASGHVAYGRTVNFLSMSVDPKLKHNSAQFSLPTGVETGASSFYVVANGIASAPMSVTVQ
jgi:hypothetical protein